MAKNLKLTGLASYTNGVMGTTVLKKGQTGRFDDHIADKIMASYRLNTDGEKVSYWTEVADDAPVDHVFVTQGTHSDVALAQAVVAAPKTQRVARTRPAA